MTHVLSLLINKTIFTLITYLIVVINVVYTQKDMYSTDYKKNSVIWLDENAFVVNHKSKEVKQLYANLDYSYYITETGEYPIEEVETMISKGSDPSYWQEQSKFTQKTFNTMLSVVGPYVSFKQDYYYDGGAHPSYGTFFETYSVDADTCIRLQDLFEEKKIIKALVRDTFIQKYFISDHTPSTLDQLFSNLDGACDYYFSLESLSHFAFHHIDRNHVAVRIGISYGCEVMRGNFSQLEIHLPIPKKLRKLFKKANKNHTLMKDLSDS